MLGRSPAILDSLLGCCARTTRMPCTTLPPITPLLAHQSACPTPQHPARRHVSPSSARRLKTTRTFSSCITLSCCARTRRSTTCRWLWGSVAGVALCWLVGLACVLLCGGGMLASLRAGADSRGARPVAGPAPCLPPSFATTPTCLSHVSHTCGCPCHLQAVVQALSLGGPAGGGGGGGSSDGGGGSPGSRLAMAGGGRRSPGPSSDVGGSLGGESLGLPSDAGSDDDSAP